jgi:sporulation protein YlmC with PRC-barrel domain
MRNLAIGAFCAATLVASAALAQSSTNMNNANDMKSTNSATTSPSGMTGMAASSVAGDWRASKLAGLDIYNNANEKIGDVNDVLIDKTGKVTGVVIGVGGFLGMGEHDVLVSFNELKFVDEPARTASSGSSSMSSSRSSSTVGSPATQTTPSAGSSNAMSDKWYPDHAVLNATKDQLKAMPEFKYSDAK